VNIAAVSRGEKSTPYCEILWRGPAEKEGKTEVYSDWLEIGRTKYKEKTISPVWKRDDGGIFELPPIWTNYEISDRGPNATSLQGGGWVAKNLIPHDDPAASRVKGSALDKLLRDELDAKANAQHKVRKHSIAYHSEEKAFIMRILSQCFANNIFIYKYISFVFALK
jgi:hypothetical protein